MAKPRPLSSPPVGVTKPPPPPPPPPVGKGNIPLGEFPVSSTPQLRQKLLLGEEYEQLLRERLPTPLYWWQPERLVFWNERLVIHYVHCGFRTDTPEHQRLIEQYQIWLKKLGA